MNSWSNTVNGVALAVCGLLALAHPASATPITQTTAPAGSNSSPGNDAWQLLGSVTLAQGTNSIVDLSSAVTLVDQGWGGSDPTNGVRIDLFANGVDLWGNYVAGAGHSWSTQNYDLAGNSALLAGINAIMAGINWSTDPTITLAMDATPWPYVGWALHTTNAAFSVTSNTIPVPEPMSLALFATGLAAFSVMRWRKGA